MAEQVLIAQREGFTGGLKRMFMGHLRDGGINPVNCVFQNLTYKCAIKHKKGRKVEWTLRDEAHDAVYKRLEPFKNWPLIICNDPVFLAAITKNRHRSLFQCRGSVYQPWPDRPPILVFDDVTRTRYDKHAGMVIACDIAKAKRWMRGKQIPQPTNRYTLVCDENTIEEFLSDGLGALAIAMDIETSGAGPTAQITVSGYSMLRPDYSINTYVLPFVAPWMPDARFWTDELFEKMLNAMRQVHDTDTVKIMQNGAYDSSYFVKYRMPPRAYIYDTAVASHAFWVTQPKRLDFLASIYCDFYAFWKDERAESAADDAEKTDVKVPQTKAGFIDYCRYNAADCYYTLMVALVQSNMLAHESNDWVLDNFTRHMRAWCGPAFRMSCAGVPVDSEIQQALSSHWQDERAQNLADLRVMTNTPDFNPNSPHQVAAFLYDFLRTPPIPRKGKSADEKVLKLVATQGVIEAAVIAQIGKTKKPANNQSKYGIDPETGRSNLFLLNNRWLYTMNPIGTKMERYASKKHHFWCGTNIQNVPYEVRSMVRPDDGFVLIDADYSASDAWFTAYSADSAKMIALMNDDRDTHCVHAAEFFRRSYEDILEGYKNGEDWVVHSTEGVRQNTKRIVYGANYLMAGYTMLITMGPEAVVATAQAMGHDNAPGWDWKQLIEFCQSLIDFYFNEMYPELKPWLDSAILEIATAGGFGTSIGGFRRKFFGDPMNDNEVQREIASFFGQAGTARNINNAIDKLYYETDFFRMGGRLYFQCHDSLVAAAPEEMLHELVPILHGAMYLESTAFSGKKFRVPVGIDVGYGWGKSMLMKYRNDLTLDELRAHHRKAKQKILA